MHSRLLTALIDKAVMCYAALGYHTYTPDNGMYAPLDYCTYRLCSDMYAPLDYGTYTLDNGMYAL